MGALDFLFGQVQNAIMNHSSPNTPGPSYDPNPLLGTLSSIFGQHAQSEGQDFSGYGNVASSNQDPYGDPGNVASSNQDPYGDPGAIASSNQDPFGDPGAR